MLYVEGLSASSWVALSEEYEGLKVQFITPRRDR